MCTKLKSTGAFPSTGCTGLPGKKLQLKNFSFLWRFMPRSGELLNFFQHITPQSLFRQRAKEEAGWKKGRAFLFTPTNLGKIFKNSIQRNEKLMRKTFPASRNTRFIFQFYLATSFPNVFIWGFCSGTRRSRRQKNTWSVCGSFSILASSLIQFHCGRNHTLKFLN